VIVSAAVTATRADGGSEGRTQTDESGYFELSVKSSEQFAFTFRFESTTGQLLAPVDPSRETVLVTEAEVRLGDVYVQPTARLNVLIAHYNGTFASDEYSLELRAADDPGATRFFSVRNGSVIADVRWGSYDARLMTRDGELADHITPIVVTLDETQLAFSVKNPPERRTIKVECRLNGAAIRSAAPELDHIVIHQKSGEVVRARQKEGNVYSFDVDAHPVVDVVVDDGMFQPDVFRDLNSSRGIVSISLRGRGGIRLTRQVDGKEAVTGSAWLVERSPETAELLAASSLLTAASLNARFRNRDFGVLELTNPTSVAPSVDEYYGVSGGPYVLWVLVDGYAPASTDIARIASGEVVEATVRLLPQSSVVEVHVLDRTDQRPLTAARIEVCALAVDADSNESSVLPIGGASSKQARMRRVLATAITDESGTAFFTDLPAGSVAIRASPNGQIWTWGLPLEIPDRGLVQTTIGVERPGALRVRVLDLDPSWADSVRAVVLDKASVARIEGRHFSKSIERTLDRDGSVLFDTLDAGTYELELAFGGGAIVDAAGSRDLRAFRKRLRDVSIVSGETVHADIQLPDAGVGGAVVSVVSNRGSDLAGGLVVVLGADGVGQSAVVEDNQFEIGPLPAGEYRAWIASVDGRLFGLLPELIPIESDRVTSRNTVLTFTADALSVSLKDGTMLSGQGFDLKQDWIGGKRYTRVVADQKGIVELDLLAGSYGLRLRGESSHEEVTFTWPPIEQAGRLLQFGGGER